MTDIETQIEQLLGEHSLVTEPAARERYETDWLRASAGRAQAIVRPRDTAEVAQCVAWCAANGVGVVPQGGHTGLAGGATPSPGASQIVLSLERLVRVREVDTVSNTITVEAGAILQQVQATAQAHDRLFPLSLGAEGSCQIGGCISTNAGGTAVLRYGNMRDLVLGVEAVLPDGRVWSGLKSLRKDNAGFDLKQLFIGTEGTLGVVTAATLRLFPRPQQRLVALLSTADARSMLQLFVRVRDRFDTELTAFEFMSAEAVTMACQHLQKTHPLPDATGCCVLLELASLQPGETLNDALLDCLEKASEDGLVDEAAMATSQRQTDLFWSVRESVPVAMLQNFPRCSPHDISVPISKIPDFIDQMQTLTASRWPQLESLVFGHVGDGNLHWNFLAQEALAPSQFAELASEATLCLYEHTVAYGGSISAEHGIGLHKKALLERFAPEGQLRLMRALKGALDGSGVMNPGKIF